MNTHVNFEIAKLLKEKGYEQSRVKKNSHYNDLGILDSLGVSGSMVTDHYYAPTIAEVVMWLYEKHGLWVEVVIEQPNHFGYDIFKVKNNVSQVEKFISYNSPTEAYEAAITYVLNNII